MKRRSYRTQEPPFSLSLELSQGCNLRCPFCGIAGIQEKQGQGYKFMSREVMTSVMQQVRDLGWSSRIGFAMRGDPALHPEVVEMVAIVHEHRPRATKLMLTNGGGLLRKPGPAANVRALFEAGLTVLGLDHYQNVGYVPKILEAIESQPNESKLRSGRKTKSGFTFYEYPQDTRGNPHKRWKSSERVLVRIRDIAWTASTDKKGNHNRLSNHAGAGAPLNDRMAGKRCALPFRQLAIHQDGSVSLCCNDWRGVYHCGTVMKEGIEAIWNGPAFGAAREMLIRGRREFKPCLGCDHRSFRNGLLPDLQGRGRMHKPDEQTSADIAEALSHGPQVQPVLREWER